MAMSFTNELVAEVSGILQTSWETRDGYVVPEPENVQLGNDAVKIDGTVLYADMADSTNLVNNYPSAFAARVFKSYLISACRIIRKNDGVITAFDGDRVMAVFIGDYKNTSATLCALQINYAVLKILNLQLQKQYPKTAAGFQLKHAVGIDTGELFVARTGIRGSNDLVWVGNPANFAAKMSSLREETYASWITDSVYKMINKSAKFSNDQNMWETRGWLGRTIYRSNWYWAP
jgi:class 3 adenylate cyclase